MSRKKISLLIILFVSIFSLQAQENKKMAKILFVGNSYTYVHNMPQLVALISENADTKLLTRKSTVPGAFLSEHWQGKRGLKSLDLIKNGNFDAVVVQENSMGTIIHPDSTKKYAGLLCKYIRQSGAKPYLYMTWAREKVPQYQEQISQIYTEIAKANGAVLVPVGEAWKLARQLRPDLDLYQPDGSHQTNLGALLTATVFVGALTGKVPDTIPEWYQTKDMDGETVELTNMDNLDAVFFQQVATEILNKYGLLKK